jgi:hypothetical protein
VFTVGELAACEAGVPVIEVDSLAGLVFTRGEVVGSRD